MEGTPKENGADCLLTTVHFYIQDVSIDFEIFIMSRIFISKEGSESFFSHPREI